jgi:membrane-associated phospholipid phosphatase
MVGRLGKFSHDYSPIPFVILIYQSLGELIQHLHPDIDPWLIQMDLSLFGVHPTIWMERWVVPWLTDIMSFAYGSYYFLPVILIATLYLNDRRQLFNTSMFVLVFGYYISFIGYIFFPAIGPRYTLAHLYSVPLEGSFLTDAVRDGLNALEHNKRDVMPSGHTQIALMVLYLAYRYQKVLFYPFLFIIIGLIVSTVYLRYHYVIDLIAGAVIAAGCLPIALRLPAWWDRL